MNHINKQKKIANAMLIVMLAGVLLLILFIAKVFEREILEILFLVFGLSAVLLGLIFYFVFKYQAEQFDLIIKGNQYLAKWHVDKFEWTNFIEKDYLFNQKKSFKMLKISLWVIVPVIIIGCCMMENYSEMLLFSGIMAGTIVLTTFIIYILNFQKYNSRKKISFADIIVTEKALIINSEFYMWGVLGSRFEYFKNLDGENMVRFVYSVASRSGRVNQEINVPIGQAGHDEIKKIMEFFSKKNNIK